MSNQDLALKIRDAGLKPTAQRIAILKELLSRTDHPGADMVYKKLKSEYPSLSMNTIYLNLETFVRQGVIQRINNLTNLGRFDGNAKPHHHFICTKCKKIIDPNLGSLKDLTKEVIEETGFQIINHRVDFFGTCRECQSREA